jgi:hypothetical protein
LPQSVVAELTVVRERSGALGAESVDALIDRAGAPEPRVGRHDALVLAVPRPVAHGCRSISTNG